MKVEIVVPVWGAWFEPWSTVVLPSLRAEAASIGASIVVYTDVVGRAELEGIETRLLPPPFPGTDLDRADRAHADALGRAVAAGSVISPLMADMLPGRGTFAAGLRCLNAGSRAVMAINLPTPMPSWVLLGAGARELSAWMGTAAGILWWGRPSPHPGHYGWSCGPAALIRPIYIPPVLVRPVRAAIPTRAMDHFLVEECLERPDQVAYLDPAEGCVAGIPLPVPAQPAVGHENGPVLLTEDDVARWMLAGNARSWNMFHMAQRFWCGEPDWTLRASVEAASDAVVGEIARRFHGDHQGR